MPRLRALAAPGIVMWTPATEASVVNMGRLLLVFAGWSGSGSESVATAFNFPGNFSEIDERTLSSIAKYPNDHARAMIIIYGYVTELEASTGRCPIRPSVSKPQASSRFEYEHDFLAYSGEDVSTCPRLEAVIADDKVNLDRHTPRRNVLQERLRKHTRALLRCHPRKSPVSSIDLCPVDAPHGGRHRASRREAAPLPDHSVGVIRRRPASRA